LLAAVESGPGLVVATPRTVQQLSPQLLLKAIAPALACIAADDLAPSPAIQTTSTVQPG